MKPILLPLGLSLLWATMSPAGAHDAGDTLFDTVSLSVEAQTEVDNDRVEAVLFAEREGNVAAPLADAVNRDIDWALDLVKSQAGIDATTPAYQTFPIYQQSRITGWRVRQTLHLASADAAAMSDMLGKLQTRLGLQGVSFVLSSDKRRTVQEQLTHDALGRFTARAQMIARTLGRGGYRLVNLQVNDGGFVQPRAQLAMMRSQEAVAAPRLEGGSSDVQVSVSGTIQLKD